MTSVDSQSRLVSSIRPTGAMHIGHYHGVLKNWLSLQYEYDCFFFAADLHALTTHYENPKIIEEYMWNMIIDWVAIGINPASSHIFIQSKIPEHAELTALLSMITPLSWLERFPSYKYKQEKLRKLDLSTHGFLGYPLLQSADILLYRAGFSSVGTDKEIQLELTREIARRFNHLYGREPSFEKSAETAINKMNKKTANIYRNLRKNYLEKGDLEALKTARALLKDLSNITVGDQERLFGYLEGTGKMVLTEPFALLSNHPSVIGIDGQKMSNSYNNTITFRDDSDTINTKIRKMPTDPARQRLKDPGEPENCPIWQLHLIYSNLEDQKKISTGCRQASIGCIDCKKIIIDACQEEIQPIRMEIENLNKDQDIIKNIVSEGCEIARHEAKNTLKEVKEAIGIYLR